MKKIIVLLLLPLLIFSIIACKDKEEEHEKKGKLIKMVEHFPSNNEFSLVITYYYDNQNRLIKHQQSQNGDTASISIKYSANTIITTLENVENEISTWFFNENGYLIGDDNNSTYIYENGYLKEWKGENGNKVEYSWQNGNMVQINGATFEYNNKKDLLNINPFFFKGNNTLTYCGVKLKGWTSKNYVIKETHSVPCDHIITYEYIFDKDGYPIQIIWYFESEKDGKSESKLILTYY